MDPLVVAGDVGEGVDLLLRDLVPVGHPPPADRRLELVHPVHGDHAAAAYPAAFVPGDRCSPSTRRRCSSAASSRCPKSITDDDGHPVNALLGTTNLVLCEVERYKPRAVVLCFGARRRALPHRAVLGLPRRPAARARRARVAVGRRAEFFEAFGWYVALRRRPSRPTTCSARTRRRGGGRRQGAAPDRRPRHVPVRDRQGEGAVRARPARGAEQVDRREVEKRYGIAPEQVPDFIALRGDPSDGLPGAKGIGEKTAASILRKHGSLEAAIENGRRGRRAFAGV